MRIVFATGNEGKMREIRDILADVDAEVLSLKDLGLHAGAEENGETFAENARIKILEIAGKLGPEGMRDTIVMADDSGLAIDRLYGAPGVQSARFMGYDTDYALKNSAILEMMRKVPAEERGAAFVCHVSAISAGGRIFEAEDEMRGRVAYEAKGGQGFGYDPIFFLPEFGMTSAEITEEEKNEISHRGKALRRMKEILMREGLLRLSQENAGPAQK